MVGESAVAESTMGKKSPTSELGTYNLITGEVTTAPQEHVNRITLLPCHQTIRVTNTSCPAIYIFIVIPK
jgi:hypothetical protein